MKDPLDTSSINFASKGNLVILCTLKVKFEKAFRHQLNKFCF